jgi:hypothetical protein
MERAHGVPISTPPRPNHNGRRAAAGTVLRMRAWLSRRRLDRALAAGAAPSSSLLRQRARKLTGARMRELVASSVERAVSRAEHPNPPLSSAVPVSATAVREAKPALLSLAFALRDPDPVSPQGVARAWRLVTDGGSPLYDPHPNRLSEEVRAATAALHLGPMLDDANGK